MIGFGRAAVRRDARSDARHVTAMKLPKVTCRSLTDTRPELCLQRRACQMPRSMAARACVDAAVAHVLATGGGVRDATELATAYLQRSGHPPRSDRTLIRLVRENSAFRRASAAMAHAAERVAAARILAGEPQWLVARTSRVDLARSQQSHPPGPPAGLGVSQSGVAMELGGLSVIAIWWAPSPERVV